MISNRRPPPPMGAPPPAAPETTLPGAATPSSPPEEEKEEPASTSMTVDRPGMTNWEDELMGFGIGDFNISAGSGGGVSKAANAENPVQTRRTAAATHIWRVCDFK